MIEKMLSKESGQSLVLVAAALVALVLFVAITVDVSSAYYNRRTAQNAADGAALAGASRLATQINNRTKLDGQIQIDMNDLIARAECRQVLEAEVQPPDLGQLPGVREVNGDDDQRRRQSEARAAHGPTPLG